MTLKESINATVANTRVYSVSAEGFTKAFRTDELGNILPGEEFTIPEGEDFVVINQRIMRNGEAVKDREGNEVYAQFVKCKTSAGRVVNFYPTALTKIAFRVDPESGKDVVGAERIVRTAGNLVDYVKKHPDMKATMEQLKGCTIKCEKLDPIPVRAFGVSNDKATKADVETNNIGTWSLVGAKKPSNWEELLYGNLPTWETFVSHTLSQ